jgi:hypothetical protein
MATDYEIAMNKLYTAKWNIPQATTELGMANTEANWQHVKELFSEYCKQHPPNWTTPSA